MGEKKTGADILHIDTKELELPDTTFVRDVDNKVFHGIIVQCLSKIEGIALLEGNLIDHVLGRSDGVKGLHTEQDPKQHSLKVKIEVNIAYGVSIPEKAEEIQTVVVQELTKYTGLHVSEVHVVFKGLVPTESEKQKPNITLLPSSPKAAQLGEEYSDIF